MNTSQIVATLTILSAVTLGHAATVRAMPDVQPYHASNALQSAHEASRFEVWPDGPNAVEGAPSVILVREMRIIGDVPHAARATSLVWTCGPVEANRVGGSQRTCEWVRP